MKKLLIIIFACVCAMSARAYELYTVWTSSNKTITFYYDNSRSSRSGDKIEVITSSSLHWGTISSVAEKMVLTSSMQNYSPTSLEDFFVGGGGYYQMTAVKSITGLNYLNTANVTNMSGMFRGMSALQSLDLSTFNTAKVTNMSSMFSGCQSLTSLNLSSFSSAVLQNMDDMFNECANLITLTFGNSFTASQVRYFSEVFMYCEKLTSLNLSKFNLVNAQSMRNTFQGCRALSTLTLPTNLNTLNVGDMQEMFKDCTALTSISLKPFNVSNCSMFYNMFDGCTSLQSVDMRNLVFYSSLGMYEMFNGCSNLRTIYCDEDLSSIISSGYHMFYGCTKLQGNNGTTYDANNANATYARPDRGAGQPGYFTTNLGPIIVCDAPTNVTVSNITKNSATIDWTAPSEHNAWYILYGTNSINQQTIYVYEHPYRLTGLSPNTTYTVKVKGTCGGGSSSEYSSGIQFTTLSDDPTPPDPEECKAPIEMATGIITANSALVFWSPQGTESKWHFIYKRTGDANYLDVTVQDNPYYQLNNLEPNTSYSANVYAICSADSWSSWYNDGIDLTFKTAKAEGFDNVSAEPAATKIIRNGQLIILVGDKTFDAQGKELK